jgi:DNA-binding Lrp family transcriptional regulator
MKDNIEKQIILKLQEDFPLVPEPYRKIAEDIGISEEELLKYISDLKNNKTLRRIGAVLNHRTVGFMANAMVVWAVPNDRVKEVSDIMVSYSQVSHCYERAVSKDWNFNIYTMIHSVNYEACEEIIKQISITTGINRYEVLYSTKELKKSSMVYTCIGKDSIPCLSAN